MNTYWVSLELMRWKAIAAFYTDRFLVLADGRQEAMDKAEIQAQKQGLLVVRALYATEAS